MSSVPEDVTPTILCQLPVKSLIRFKCINKRFCSMIESKDFIKLHLKNNSVDNNTKLKLIHHSETRFFCLDLTADSSTKFDGPFGQYMTKILGSCNGLLCVLKWEPNVALCKTLPRKSNILPRIALWNPSTHKFHIPRAAPIEVTRLDRGYTSVDFTYAFGYDSVNDDYKVLRIVRLKGHGTAFEVMVFRLRTNSWKTINVSQASHDHLDEINNSTNKQHVLAHNAFHWLSYRMDESIMIAFDLHREEFRTLPLPKLEAIRRFSTLGLLGQCLCLCLCLKSSRYKPSEVWIMKEYGIKDSWVKLFSLKRPPSLYFCVTQVLSEMQLYPNDGMQLVPFSENDGNEKLLLQQLFREFLMWYDWKRNKYECVRNPAVIRGIEKNCYAYTFVESLVSPFGDGSKSTRNKMHRKDEDTTSKKKRGRDEQAPLNPTDAQFVSSIQKSRVTRYGPNPNDHSHFCDDSAIKASEDVSIEKSRVQDMPSEKPKQLKKHAGEFGLPPVPTSQPLFTEQQLQEAIAQQLSQSLQAAHEKWEQGQAAQVAAERARMQAQIDALTSRVRTQDQEMEHRMLQILRRRGLLLSHKDSQDPGHS